MIRMKAMVLKKLCNLKENPVPLEQMEVTEPVSGEAEILVKVSACGVCHTELDEIEGRTPPSYFPVIPGHQVVGRVAAIGAGVDKFKVGDRVGIAWIHSACGTCKFCLSGRENLCRDFKATGRDANGGYAEYTTVSQEFAYLIPENFSDAEAAPLLCAGAVGYRSLKLTGILDGQTLGLMGFGASGHLVLKMAQHRYPHTEVAVFTRNVAEQNFAKELGAAWAGEIGAAAPWKLDCMIDTTPAWRPVVAALENLEPGGRFVINAIGKEEADKEELLKLNYPAHLWCEKEIKSVANVTRQDVSEFLELVVQMQIRPEIQEFPLEEANEALLELRNRKIRGAKVLRIE